MKLLSINILTWNNLNTLTETLNLLKDDLKDIYHEIIIVDNGSSDGCQEFATIKNKRNLGVSVGKNQGIRASKGDYILLLDGDIVPVPNSINCLLNWLEAHPSDYAIGFHPNKFSNQKNTDTNKHHEVYCKELFRPQIHPQAIIFYGMFRREIFDSVMLDEKGPFSGVGYGWEDTDFYYQMREKGFHQYAAGINTSIGKYYHEINSSIREMGNEKYIRSSRERAAYFKEKWGEKRFDVE